MTSRVVAHGRAVTFLLLLLALLCLCRPGRAATRLEAVTLSRLRESGVIIHTQARFEVKQIEVNGGDVTRLLKVEWPPRPAWWKFFAETAVMISVDDEHVDELRAVLDEAPLKQLKVTLLDEHPAWRMVPWSDDEELYKPEYIIPVETKCEEITNIFYQKINSLVADEIRTVAAGSTSKPVDINEVFGKLVEGKLKAYMDTLGPIRRDARCQTTFELLNWLKGGEVAGFVSGKYRLREDLKGLLETTIRAVEAVKADWPQYDLRINVIGYTDLDKVESPVPLSANQTGVYWGNVKDPPEVYYDRCSGDILDKSVGAAYLGFEAGGGRLVGEIENNCELGAVRAYVATVYLFNRFGLSNVTYSYATGGVHPKSDPRRRAFFSEQRKIDIVFTLNAARDVR